MSHAIIGVVSRWFVSYGYADVHDDLIVGAYPVDAHDVATVRQLGVTRVLNLVEDDEYEPGERAEVEQALAGAGIVEARLSLIDYGHLPADQLEAAVQQVVGWLDAGERVYLHCRAGWQRSAAVAAGAVAIHTGVDIEAALAQVQRRKPSANPLPHQREELVRWWDARSEVTPPREAGAG